jgi:hypothetical protein
VTSSVRPKFAFLLDRVPVEFELIYDNNGMKGQRVRIFRFHYMN